MMMIQGVQFALGKASFPPEWSVPVKVRKKTEPYATPYLKEARYRMTSHDKFGNEVQVGDLLVSEDSSRDRQLVCFVKEILREDFAYAISMHVSPRHLMSFDGRTAIDPTELILLAPVTAKVTA